jgi:hypothetical protein
VLFPPELLVIVDDDDDFGADFVFLFCAAETAVTERASAIEPTRIISFMLIPPYSLFDSDVTTS